jgi:DNA-binding response OmpR family regulator
MRCLVIEDQADTAHYICRGQAGFTVVWCNSGMDGPHAATNEHWDILMPVAAKDR